jgi:predicted 2-oxoglutarate/Fe(II)-dependent dioxygenase YbiX
LNTILKYNIQSINFDNLIEYAYSLKKSEFGNIGRKSNVNGFQTKEIYKSDDIVIPLFNEISKIINTNCKQITCSLEVELGYYWININGKGSYNEKHHHMGNTPNSKKQSILSGVFYLSVPEGDSGNIIFTNKDGSDNSIHPVNGDLLLFSPSMVHRVETNNTNEERISLAFNYIKSSKQQTNSIF